MYRANRDLERPFGNVRSKGTPSDLALESIGDGIRPVPDGRANYSSALCELVTGYLAERARTCDPGSSSADEDGLGRVPDHDIRGAKPGGCWRAGIQQYFQQFTVFRVFLDY